MSVDLERLREAWAAVEDGIWSEPDRAEEHEDVVWDAAEAVLDAPTVWWCETHESISDNRSADDPPDDPVADNTVCESWAQGSIGECSMSLRALVPVVKR